MPNRPLRTMGIAILLTLPLAFAGCSSLAGARLYRSGTAALDGGDSERAIADLERAAELVPMASEVQNHLGLAYAAAGRDEDAQDAFRRAIDLDCGNRAAVENLSAARRRTGEVAP